jgi:hypothetical protein
VGARHGTRQYKSFSLKQEIMDVEHLWFSSRPSDVTNRNDVTGRHSHMTNAGDDGMVQVSILKNFFRRPVQLVFLGTWVLSLSSFSAYLWPVLYKLYDLNLRW